MKKARIWRNTLIILLFVVFLGFADNPWKLPKLNTEIPVVTSVWNWLQDSHVHLGLDLQGGTQLDYEIDLREAHERNNDDNPDNDVDINSLLDGVKEVIDKRVNSLGVAEPNIYLSSVGEEQHIVVELPGQEDMETAKKRVGEVVQLEFKTEREEIDPTESAEIRREAQDFLAEVKAEEDLEDLESYVEDQLAPNKVEYHKEERKFLDQIPEGLRGLVADAETGAFYNEVVQSKEVAHVFYNGQYQQPEGFNVFRVTEKNPQLRKRPFNAEPFSVVAEELGQAPSEDFYALEDIQPTELQQQVSTLGTAEITGVVEAEDGFYIAQLTNKLEAEEDNVQIHTAHILFKTRALQPTHVDQEFEDIPEGITEEEIRRLEDINFEIEEQNLANQKENIQIEAENEEAEILNAEAKKRAEEILAMVLENPERFNEFAREHSEDTSADRGGDLGFSSPSSYVTAYQEAALELEKGEITDELVKSEFGYHIIKMIDKKEADEERYQFATLKTCYDGQEGCASGLTKDEAKAQADELLRRVREETAYSLERVWFNAIPDPWAKTELDGRFFKRADVAYDQNSGRPYVAITFDNTGAEMFAQITGDNINKRIGIFVGGEFISAPTVNEKITGGNAQITLGQPNPQLALQEANELARSLNAGSIPAPLKKPNELNIGASLGSDSLQKSLQAGIIGLLLLSVFMVLYYRFMGLVACASLVVYGLFLLFVIQSEAGQAISVLLTFLLWISFALSLFKSKVDFMGKVLFITLSIIGVYFIFSVLVNPIVLTLAGVAGLILSIGMAVDANILIFERMKEEFASGKSLTSAIHDGFERAWSSILDSNVSTLITCGILYFFGTSIIRGFSINLAVGVVISMFTAITVTKTFLLIFQGTKIERVKWLWKRKEASE